MLQALRIRDFRLLWAGGLVSSLGSWLLILAIPAHVLLATGSLRDTGLTLAAEYLPLLVLGPVAGVVADRLGQAAPDDRRRPVLRGRGRDDAARHLARAVLGAVPGADRREQRHGPLEPALQAMTPAVVGTGPLLSSANSLTSASGGIVRLIGGPLGGDPPGGLRHADWLICADALSYCNGRRRHGPDIPVGSPPRPSPRGRETRGRRRSPRPAPMARGPCAASPPRGRCCPSR